MTDPARIQRIVEIAIDAALGEVARQQGGIAEPTGTEARESGVQAAMAIAASQAVAPPEPVAVKWDDEDHLSEADCGEMVLVVWPTPSKRFAWRVSLMPGTRDIDVDTGTAIDRDAAKAAAIAAARAWRDSIRL